MKNSWQRNVKNTKVTKPSKEKWESGRTWVLQQKSSWSSRTQHWSAQRRRQWLHRSAQQRRSSGTYVGWKVLTYNNLKRHSLLYILMPVNLNAPVLCIRCWQRFRVPHSHVCVREMTAASASVAWHRCGRKLQRTRISCPEQSLDILPKLCTAKLSKTSKNDKKKTQR